MLEETNARQILMMGENDLLLLLEKYYDRIVEDKKVEPEWISAPEAKALLKIKSSTTLIKYKNEGLIKYSELGPRHILFSRSSILEFISSRAKETF